jgi:hypothetical protein
MKMELFGVLKEIHLQRKKEAKEMAERLASNFVLSKRIRLDYKFLSLALVALSLVAQVLQHQQNQQHPKQKRKPAQPADNQLSKY